MSAALTIPEWRATAPRGISLAVARLRTSQRDVPTMAVSRRRLPEDSLSRILNPRAAGRWLMPQLASITPSYIENVLRGALGGNQLQQWELFDLMEDTWPRLAKNLNEIKRAALCYEWKLKPYEEEGEEATADAKRRADVVRRAVATMQPRPEYDESGFKGMIYDVLDAWAKGTAVVEVDWEVRDAGKVGEIAAPRAAFWVHPNQYGWGEEGFLGLRSMEQRTSQRGVPSVEPFPEDKFLVAICKSRSGHPLAGALLRPLAWWWCAANFSASWLLNLAQIFGLPIRWATYDPTSPGLLDQVSEMLENMGSEAWGAFPAGTTIELKEPLKAAQDSPQADLLDRADKNCDLLILGQTLTTDVQASGSRALGDVHADVKAEIVESVAGFGATVLNEQLVPMILRLNFGDATEAPCFHPQEAGADEAEKLKFKRDVFAKWQQDGTVSDILANQTDIKALVRDVGLEVNEEYIDPYLPVQDAAGQLVTGELLKDSEGDVIGAIPEPEVRVPNGAGSREQGANNKPGEDGVAMAARNKIANSQSLIAKQKEEAELRAKAQAQETERLIDSVLEDLTGVSRKWLGGVKPFFAELVAKAKDESLSDADFIRALERASGELPELFGKLKPDELAEALEGAMGAAVINGAVQGAMQRKSGRRSQDGRRSAASLPNQ